MSKKNSENSKPLKPALGKALRMMERLQKGDAALLGIETGFSDLDAYLAGLQPGTLTVIAGIPSVGKTSLALAIAKYTAVAKKPVGFFSLDLSEERIINRLLSAEARVPLWRLNTGRLDKTDVFKIKKAAQRLSDAQLLLYDIAAPAFEEIKSIVHKLYAQKHLSLLIIDCLQSIWIDPAPPASKQLTEIARGLKGIAVSLDIPTLLTVQVKANPEDRIPSLKDLRYYGNIERSSDAIIFLHRQREAENSVQLLVEQHRNGPTGIVKLCFNEEEASFYPAPKTALSPR